MQEITLEVQPVTLPAPETWKMHLDLWQHPQSVARWHDAEPWSTAHFEHLRPLMQRLAAAGQKCITCTLLDEAWNAQTYDWFPSMNSRLAAIFTVERSSQYYIHAQDVKNARAIVDETLTALNALQGGAEPSSCHKAERVC